jgi:hypothetical protein
MLNGTVSRIHSSPRWGFVYFWVIIVSHGPLEDGLRFLKVLLKRSIVLSPVVAETCWFHYLLLELHLPLDSAIVVCCDDVLAVYMSANPVQTHHTKYIELDIHFVREKVAIGALRVLHVRGSDCRHHCSWSLDLVIIPATWHVRWLHEIKFKINMVTRLNHIVDFLVLLKPT